jgi:hypothetical protein
MRILAIYKDCGPSYVFNGWRRVFEALGHEWFFWRPGAVPAHDAFARSAPDLFIGSTFDLDRATEKCLQERPHCRVALYASAWGPLIDELDLAQYPIVAVTADEKRRLEAFRTRTGKPDFVFLHVTPRYLEPVLGGWRTIGIEPAGILNAADTFSYLGGTERPELAADVAFVGGYWPYKARNLDRYIVPLCDPSLLYRGSPANLSVKIWGNQRWPVPNYLGPLREELARDVFRSATVCPNVGEPHATRYGFDLVERPFKVLCAGGFCVSDHTDCTSEVFAAGELPVAHNHWSFCEAVCHFAHNPQDREPYMRAGRKAVLTRHTYFHRVAQVFAQLDLAEETARTMALHRERVLEPEGLV